MKVLMLVATTVATDTRVLREATTLVNAGNRVHVVGRSVPPGYEPPDGVTVSSVGTSSVFRKEGGGSLAGRRLSPHMRLARWILLPQHRDSAFRRWAAGAVEDGRGREFDVVHAHDYTALEAGATLARERGVPLVYDTHELWYGRPREYRPTPLADRRERRVEAALGAEAAAVVTVGAGVADALRRRYGWKHVVVVRNTFPPKTVVRDLPQRPAGLIYAGRLGAFRELETIAAASVHLDLPVTLIGPADETWLGGFARGRTTVEPPIPVAAVDERLAAAGLVLVTHSDRWENHRLALPNKLFHAVRVGVPVVATDVGELGSMVRRYGLGVCYPPGDADGLVRAVATARSSYDELRVAVAAAAETLSWEHDGRVLLELYERLGGAATGREGIPPTVTGIV